MRIAIVSGHFMPEIGYQEVYLARAFRRIGYEVRVITSTSISPTGKKIIHHDYEPGISTDAKYGYVIVRLKSKFAYKAKVIASGLQATLDAFNPDIIILVGLAKLFGFELVKLKPAGHAKVISVFGENADYTQQQSMRYTFTTLLQKLNYASLKPYLYRKAVRYCDRIILSVTRRG